MTIQWNKDDLFYVCTMIEYVSRKTNNKSKDVVVRISDKALAHQLKVAGINHCLSFEQVADEWIEEFEIPKGNYDNISECRYEVPTVTSIGRVQFPVIKPESCYFFITLNLNVPKSKIRCSAAQYVFSPA